MTENKLFKILDKQFVWREKEILDYKSIILEKENTTFETPLVRGGITIVYGHFEGFVKETVKAFLEFLNSRKIKLNEYNINIQTLIFYKNSEKERKSKQFEQLVEISNFYLKKQNENFVLPNEISTESNLKYKVLKNILCFLNFELVEFETKKFFINNTLLSYRNAIAHGENKTLKYNDFEEISKNTIEIIENFKNQIKNSVLNKKYLNKINNK